MRGAYFIANDRIYDLATTFLASFRQHNPDMPLCLIPFDDDHQAVARLQGVYSFDVFEDACLLASFDRISTLYHGRVVGNYRKLAAWFGSFERFLYVDSDSVILKNLTLVEEFARDSDILVATSNLPSLRQWVWKDAAVADSILAENQLAFAANTGFFCSRKDLFSLDEIKQAATDGLKLKNYMELHCAEQPFLNYLWVISPHSYASLMSIAWNRRSREVPLELWAGDQTYLTQGREVLAASRNPIFMIHWAGEWQQDRHLQHPVWGQYQKLHKEMMMGRIP